MDYIRWMFSFCTPRYLIIKELLMDKLRVGWGIKARRFENKIKSERVENLTNASWEEKKNEWRGYIWTGKNEVF